MVFGNVSKLLHHTASKYIQYSHSIPVRLFISQTFNWLPEIPLRLLIGCGEAALSSDVPSVIRQTSAEASLNAICHQQAMVGLSSPL